MSEIRCPVCGERIDPERDLIREVRGFPILRCPACTLRFRPVDPASWNAAAAYPHAYFSGGTTGEDPGVYRDYLRDEALHRSIARKRLRRIGKRCSPGKILDVGCAAGFFLDEARKCGWKAEGIDVSRSMCDVASGMGIATECGEFRDVSIPEGAFDVVTMWDYIEHSADPSGDLQKAHRTLVPGGFLMLSTGDIGSLVAKLSGKRWHLMTPEHHLAFFTERAMRTALKGAEFSEISVSRPGASYSVAYLLHKLRTAGDYGFLRGVARVAERSVIGRIPVPVNLRDIMTVVARKRP